MRRPRGVWTRRTFEDGAAAVEMALLTPLLAMLVYGVIGFGIIFTQDLAVGNGAREGARYGASTPFAACNDGTGSSVVGITRAASDTILLEPGNVTVDVWRGPDDSAVGSNDICSDVSTNTDAVCDTADPGDRVYVVTTYRSPLFVPFGPENSAFEVTGLGVFQCEY